MILTASNKNMLQPYIIRFVYKTTNHSVAVLCSIQIISSKSERLTESDNG